MQNVARIALINPAKKTRKTKKRKTTAKRKTVKRKAKRRGPARKRVARRNPAKRTTKRKTTKKRRTYKVAKKKTYRRKRPRKVTRRRRSGSVVVKVNPVEKDVIETLKTGGLMAAGAIVAYILVDYLKKSVDFVAENEWAAPAVMIAGGMGTGMILTGKNRALATKLGLGMVTTGIVTLVSPYLADKVSGLPGPSMEPLGPPSPTAGYYSPAEMGAYQRIGGFYGDEIPTPGLGVGQMLDPLAENLNTYGGGLGKGYH